MTYSVHILLAAEKECNHLPKQVFLRCQRTILKLEENPRPSGCQKLAGKGGYRIRVGDYRILYEIEDSTKNVYIFRVKHRKEAYR